MQGYVAAASTTVTFQARNWDTGVFDTLPGSAIASSAPSFTDPELFSWSTSLSLASKYWAPTQAGCSAGRAEIRTFNGGDPLKTFSPGAQQCAIDLLFEDEHPVAAGNACNDGEEVILFDNNGVCGAAETTGFTSVVAPSPLVVDGHSILWEVVSYPVQGKTIYGMICRPNDAAAHPVQIYNHGGWIGLGYAGEVEGCLLSAAKGWVVAMSAYRGERLYLPGTGQVWLSTGSVELCNGEVTDVMRLTDIVLGKSYADSSRVLMHGASHGGCVTTRAVERGARVQAAIDFAGPSEWTSLFASLGWWVVSGVPNGPTAPFPSWMSTWIGNPASVPHAYEWRSSKFVAEDLAARSDVKYLRMHGTADVIVGHDHACKLAKAAYGAAGSKNWHFDAAAAITTAAPSGCTTADASLTWIGTAKPTTSWPDDSYVFVYDALPHGVVPGDGTPTAVVDAFVADYNNFINALGWGVVF